MTDWVWRGSQVRISTCRGIRRRDFLRVIPAAGIAAGMLGWPDLMATQAQVLRRRGKACILLWMQGGPSQFETFAPCPSHAHGGETKAIATSVPGLQIAADLPQTAKVMEHVCLVRSMTSKEGSHPRATFLLHTGYLPNPSVRHPAFASNVIHQLANAAAELPAYVQIGRNRGGLAIGAGLLGVDYDPFVLSDPIRPPDNTQPQVPERRFRRRLGLLSQLDGQFRKADVSSEAQDHKKLYDRAARMMLSSHMSAFDLQREPERVRQAYGSSPFASGCLLARRLIAAGVTFVEVSLGNWDTHQDNFNQSRQLCGQLDQPYAQLIQDLKQRGMLDDTLVVWMGEFGRTPRINPRAGRDHFPRAFTVALAGGGVRGGQVVGATDAGGTTVTERPVTVPDLFRTFCSILRVDPDHENMSPIGRPIKVVDEGEVVREVVG
jgi:hypothetical protein